MRISDWSSDVCSSDLREHGRSPYLKDGGRPHATAPGRRSEEFDFLGDDVGVVVSASVALVAAVADLADDHQLVALLLVVGDRLAEAVEGLDGVELVIGLGVAVLVLLDLAVLDDRLRCDEGEADAALAVRRSEHTSELQSLMRIS